tara:strand:- start:156 stop:503 length:348 start_codon:yes stop_codon:yes gene_type:complete
MVVPLSARHSLHVVTRREPAQKLKLAFKDGNVAQQKDMDFLKDLQESEYGKMVEFMQADEMLGSACKFTNREWEAMTTFYDKYGMRQREVKSPIENIVVTTIPEAFTIAAYAFVI